MQFYIYITLVLFGIIFTHWACIRYVKGLRQQSKNNSDLYPIAMGIFFGGPSLLISYMFEEVRVEDKFKNYRYLICGITFTILQIVLTVLLIVFKVVIF